MNLFMHSDLAPVVLMGRTVVWHNCVQMSPDQFTSTGPLFTCWTLLAVWMLSFSLKKLMENITLKPRRLCQFNKTWRFLSFSLLLLLLSRLVWSSGLWSLTICSWSFHLSGFICMVSLHSVEFWIYPRRQYLVMSTAHPLTSCMPPWRTGRRQWLQTSASF